MSSLWMVYENRKNENKYKPSPAKISFFHKTLLSQTNKISYRSVKRMSLFATYGKQGSVRGSMTIEAALLIPLFIFFFLHLAGVMEMLRLHGKLEAALWNVGNQAALYTDTFSEAADALPDVGISYLLVHNQVSAYLGKEYLDNSPLVHGAAGLNYLRSEYLDDEDCVDIIVTYQVEPTASIFPFSYRRMSNRYYARAWTGYDVTETQTVKRYVYVTSQGQVWHATPECSYIYHKVLNAPTGQIAEKRNGQGRKYELCDFCGDQSAGDLVYFTEEGEKYHFISNCTAIYKDIRAIVWSDDLPYRACSRCGM